METITVKFVEEQVREIHDNLRGSLLREPSDIEVKNAIKRKAEEQHPDLSIVDFQVNEDPYIITVLMV